MPFRVNVDRNGHGLVDSALYWLCRDVTLMVKASSAMRSQGSSNQSEASSNNLQSARSMGNLAPLGSKPSWTKLQQDNLKAKRARTQHQSQGFNGLVQGTDR